jgi:hypothetical protein
LAEVSLGQLAAGLDQQAPAVSLVLLAGHGVTHLQV